MFSTILIANRGEIACRVIVTARAMGIRTVAVFSDADADALHVDMANMSVRIGPAPAAESYLKIDAIIEAAKKTGAEAIHPGYGFLSENPDFVTAVEGAGMVFIGPSADAMRKMGLKDAAKTLMEEAGVPVVPGYHCKDQDPHFLESQAQQIGYPVLIKARAGGGGKGMRKVERAGDFAAGLAGAQREAQASFGDPHVLIEKFVTSPRHIEVQIFGDSHGNVIHLFERDCSLQRRHQKVIEEAPAPGMTQELRQAMTDAAVRAGQAIAYEGAGTVEFIVDGSALRPDGFWFMEMNTRLQVEHPVTEAITGHDLVEWQIRIAAGEKLPRSQEELEIKGHAFEARVYAEDPANDFLPVTGTLDHLAFGDARIDTGVRPGDTISPWYDPLIAKIVTSGPDRGEALKAMQKALGETHVAGTITNLGFLSALCNQTDFAAGRVDTGLIEREIATLTEKVDLPETALAFAIIGALELDLSAPLAGFRLWGEAAHRVRLIYNGEAYSRRFVLHGNGDLSIESEQGRTRLEAVTKDGAWLEALVDGLSTRAEIIMGRSGPKGLPISILYEGSTYALLLPDALQGGIGSDTGDGVIFAPMTGTVRIVDIEKGDQVKKGDRLLVVEAMKMEHALTAPHDAHIGDVLCSQGDSVEGGAVLARLDASDEG